MYNTESVTQHHCNAGPTITVAVAEHHHRLNDSVLDCLVTEARACKMICQDSLLIVIQLEF